MMRISGPNVILSPPLIISQSDVDQVLGALDAGFSAL